MIHKLAALLATCTLIAVPTMVKSQASVPAVATPWMNSALSPDARTRLVIKQMTQEEKLRLVSGWFGSDQSWNNYKADPLARYASAGFVPGIPRLGIPPQWQTDAGMGVATQGAFRDAPLQRTALPSGLAVAASWNPALAERGGAMIGGEARASGLNVMLAGGINLIRDLRNGRNFEYAGEDPLLAGVMVGAAAKGIESARIVGQLKHYALNDQETGRGILNVVIDPAAARMSDLLAFEIALERSNAGSIMCAYNKVNGDYSCENHWLLTDVLKRDWGFKGFVMSDWGATHSTVKAANAGHDQETGYTKIADMHFASKLDAAIKSGQVPQTRLDDMAHRILRTMFAKGAIDHPVGSGPIDFAANEIVSRQVANETVVLLQNRATLLPLRGARRIAIVGGHADVGVLSGGGSGQVYPRGGNAAPGIEPTSWPGPVVYLPSSPMKALQSRLPDASVKFTDGTDTEAAARLAAASDVAIVFVTQWTAESRDFPANLPDNQDALVAAVAAANPRTVVVLQTGGPVLMPWINSVGAALQAWYPGSKGGEVIADVLTGRINPSGHLPVSIPKSLAQLPRPKLDGEGLPDKTQFDVNYFEGAAVGYRWFDAKGLEPQFPFGHGLSYTSFAYSKLRAVRVGQDLRVTFTVRNSGRQAGADVPQVYVGPTKGAGWEAPRRLGGFDKVMLEPGQQRNITITIDPRLLANFNETKRQWQRAAGHYTVWVGESSRDLKGRTKISLPARTLPASFDFASER